MFDRPTASQFEGPFEELSIPTPEREANDIYIPQVLDQDQIQTILDLCSEDLVPYFQRSTSAYADVDEIRFIHRGQEMFHDGHEIHEAAKTVLEIASSPRVELALRAAAELERPPFPTELLIFRMGPGTMNGVHSHTNYFTANILLQDNPRAPGSVEGLYYTGYYPTDGPLENDVAPDEIIRPPALYRHYFSPEVGSLHARKKGVQHGVQGINGERKTDPSPQECRYVLTFVLSELQANPTFREQTKPFRSDSESSSSDS